MVLRKSFYIRWSAGRSPRVHEVNPGRDPSITQFGAPELKIRPKQLGLLYVQTDAGIGLHLAPL